MTIKEPSTPITKKRAYLIGCIVDNGDDVLKDDATDKEKLQYFFDTFRSEYGWALERHTQPCAVCEYLQGMPSTLSIDVQYVDIERLNIGWGMLRANHTYSEYNHVQGNWFMSCAMMLCQMAREQGVV